MELRKSGKIAVGIIAAMGTIGALHWFIFKDSASNFQQARSEYERVIQEYNTQGNPPQMNEIHRFRYESLRYKLDFWETAAGLNLTIPEAHMPDSQGNFRTAELQQRLRQLVTQLQELRAAGENGDGPRLSFMGRRGWNFTNSLPEELIRSGVAVEDLMTNLVNEDRLLKSLDPNMPVYERRRASYAQLMARLGLDMNQREFLTNQFGKLFSTLYTLNRINNVMNALPADFFRAMRLNEQQALSLMYELFRLEWPRDFTDHVNYLASERQGRALLHMIEAGKEVGITDIVRVQFHDFRPIYWEEPVDPDAVTPTPAFGGFEWGEFDMDMERMMMMGEGMGMMGEGMMFGFGGMTQATPTPAEAFDAVGVPVEIWVQGPNSAVMSFLYRMTHSSYPYELDRLRIFTLPDQEGIVTAAAFFNVIIYSDAIGVMTEEDIQRQIVQTRRELLDVATRPGAGELAVQDGYAEQDGVTFRLTVPMPTPWGGIPETPRPPAPGSIPGMSDDEMMGMF